MDAVFLQLRQNCTDFLAYAKAATVVPTERLARFMFDIANAIDQSWWAAGTVMAASGGTAIFLNNPIQRAVRDLMAIRMHPAANLGSTARDCGRLAFTLENAAPNV
jgi:hypothetical protein